MERSMTMSLPAPLREDPHQFGTKSVEGSKDLTQELEELESGDSRQIVYAAVEHAAAGPGHRPR
eukprot:1282333-Pyramimonas_sp.AAC.1